MSEYKVKKIKMDLNNSETTTFNPFDTDNITRMRKKKEINMVLPIIALIITTVSLFFAIKDGRAKEQ